LLCCCVLTCMQITLGMLFALTIYCGMHRKTYSYLTGYIVNLTGKLEANCMKRAVGMGFFLVYLMLATSGLAAVITGVTVESVSSEYTDGGWDLRAAHVVDGSGLASGVHSQVVSPGGNSWQTSTQTGTGNIVFDLGGSYELDHLQVWNLNFYTPYNGRGASVVNLLISSDAISWDSLGNFGFGQASGLGGDPGFVIDASTWNPTRYVQFNILTNFGGQDNAGHVGLSEVQFFAAQDQPPTATPEPGTMMLMGIGAAGVAFMRRRKMKNAV